MNWQLWDAITRVYENIAGEKKFIGTWQPVIHHHEYARLASKHASRQKVWKNQAKEAIERKKQKKYSWKVYMLCPN